MSLYQLKVNNALQQNPNVAEIDITTHGSDWLWAVFSIMASTFLGEHHREFSRFLQFCANHVIQLF